MIMDSTLLFDSAVAITTTRVSTNVISLVNARDIGIGNPVKLAIVTDGLFAAAGAGTLTITLQTSVDNSTFTDQLSSIAFSIAQLNASGFLLGIDWPRLVAASMSLPKYLRLNYTVATGPFTAGVITSGLVIDRGDMVYYPAGYTTTYV